MPDIDMIIKPETSAEIEIWRNLPTMRCRKRHKAISIITDTRPAAKLHEPTVAVRTIASLKTLLAAIVIALTSILPWRGLLGYFLHLGHLIDEDIAIARLHFQGHPWDLLDHDSSNDAPVL